MNKKAFTVLNVVLIIFIIFHMCYMIIGLTGLYEINQMIAGILGTILMILIIIHGVYGLVKWIKVSINKKGMPKQSSLKLAAGKTTLIQRITGVFIILTFVPHSLIRVTSAPLVFVVLDILYVVILFFHLAGGIPKLFVSLGILNPRLENKFAELYGGGKEK